MIGQSKAALSRGSTIQNLWRRYASIFYLTLVLLFIVTAFSASVHMAYLAINTQPDCVPHSKSVHKDNTHYLAAKSSC